MNEYRVMYTHTAMIVMMVSWVYMNVKNHQMEQCKHGQFIIY